MFGTKGRLEKAGEKNKKWKIVVNEVV